MMKTCVSKPRSIKAQIRDMEQLVLIRQRGVDDRATKLICKIHQQMTAPTTLLLAGGIGFIVGELTKRQIPNSRGNADKPRVAETSSLTTALNLITWVRTLYMALPIAWIMKSFHQPGASSGRQAPNRQACQVPTASDGAGNHRSSIR